MSSLLNYKNSGVSIENGNNFVDVIKNITGNENIGGFSGIYDYKNGIKLVASTDGVGSKLEMCKILHKYDTIGIDLVAMCVNDIICQGATPLFFLDYYASHKLNIEISSQIISGIHEGCKIANCNLLGGETAEMPLTYKESFDFDLAGFVVGSIEQDVYPKKIIEDDLIYGLPSSGLHSNGYTLVHELLKLAKFDIPGGLQQLLTPTKIYVDDINNIIKKHGPSVKGFAHITGGGLIENIPRLLDKDHAIHIDGKWDIPPIFKWIFNNSDMTAQEMIETYNCGIGMAIIFDKNIDIDNLQDMIPIGKIIKSNKSFIDYDSFF